MKFTDLIKSNTEHAHQRAFFAYLNVVEHKGFAVADAWVSGTEPRAFDGNGEGIAWVKYIHAIPNGGLRDKITAGKLKAEGVKSGVPDVFVPRPVYLRSITAAHGLYIEFKRPKTAEKGKGHVAEKQTDWHTYLLASGYAVAVCYSAYAAIDELKSYLKV